MWPVLAPPLLLASASGMAWAGLEVTSLGRLRPGLTKEDEARGSNRKWLAIVQQFGIDPNRVVVRQIAANMGGNTSVRNSDPLAWKDKGYYMRNRDLGQVFTAQRTFTLDAIVLRTGPGSAAFLKGAAGAPLFVQFFEVTGQPRIDDNGTPVGKAATHGFSTNHRCDDVLRGVEYKPIRLVTDGMMPRLAGEDGGKLTYMKWDLTGRDELTFEGGKRYTFVVGITRPGKERGFTLANSNRASSPKAPTFHDVDDPYPGGWGVRREGNGRKRVRIAAENEPTDAVTRTRLQAQSLFPKGEARFAIPPTCDGYPDVDTYRDLEFYLLARNPGGQASRAYGD